MEQFFKESVDFKGIDFDEKYDNKYKHELEELIKLEFKNLNNQKEELLIVFLNSIEIFAIHSSDALLSFKEKQEKKKMLQFSLQNIFKTITDKLYDLNDNQIVAKHIDHIIAIIQIFFKENNFSVFSITSVSTLVTFLVVSKTIIILNQKQIASLLKALEINLDLRYFKYKKSIEINESQLEYFKFKNRFEMSEDKSMIDISDMEQICRTWRFCLEGLFDSFGKDYFLANIDEIQNYYE